MILLGDAKKLIDKVDDGSIDLVFADPVYQNLDDYRWLSKVAERVLKPTGSLLVWCTIINQYDIKPIVEKRLRFEAPLMYTVESNTYAMFSRKLFVWGTPCLWFSKGNPQNDYMPSGVVSRQKTAGVHKWNKNPEAIKVWVKGLTDVGDIVLDPFTGGGVVPAVCKEMGRKCIAFEMDEDAYNLAIERVKMIQMPLTDIDAEQLKMENL